MAIALLVIIVLFCFADDSSSSGSKLDIDFKWTVPAISLTFQKTNKQRTPHPSTIMYTEHNVHVSHVFVTTSHAAIMEVLKNGVSFRGKTQPKRMLLSVALPPNLVTWEPANQVDTHLSRPSAKLSGRPMTFSSPCESAFLHRFLFLLLFKHF